MCSARLSVTAVLLALALAPAAFRLEVSPHVGLAPQDMHVRVFVARDAENRWLDVWTAGDAFGRSTGVQMHGTETPGVFDFWWLALPCGAYLVRARVTRQDGSTRDARDTARFVGAACEALW